MEEDIDVADDIIPMAPVETKDKEIAILKKEIDELKTSASNNDDLKEALAMATSDLVIANKNSQISQRKLDFTKKATEQRIIDNITNPEGYREDNVLIGVYSATLDEDEFIFDESTGSPSDPRSRKDLFTAMEKKLDLNNPDQNNRFKEVTNLILEKVKHTKHSRTRVSNISNISTVGISNIVVDSLCATIRQSYAVGAGGRIAITTLISLEV